MIKLLASANQEAFDKSVAHIKALPKRSMAFNGKKGTCVYSHRHGGCAIGGPLLTAEDAEICDGQDSTSIFSLVRAHVVDAGDLDVQLLSRLQGAHDDSFNWSERSFHAFDVLRTIGHEFGLDVSKV